MNTGQIQSKATTPQGGASSVVGATANSTGNSTITPTGANQIHVVTVTGLAGTRIFILDAATAAEGDRLTLRFAQPATANIVEEVRNATGGGTLLYSYTTDGSGTDTFAAELYFDGTAWKALLNAVPVI